MYGRARRANQGGGVSNCDIGLWAGPAHPPEQTTERPTLLDCCGAAAGLNLRLDGLLRAEDAAGFTTARAPEAVALPLPSWFVVRACRQVSMVVCARVCVYVCAHVRALSEA